MQLEPSTFLRHLPYPSTPNLGTCRMREKAKDGVCDKNGKSHDIANLFISDGSQFTHWSSEGSYIDYGQAFSY